MSAAPTIDIPTKADLLIAAYMRAGYARLSPAILQPAEPFLDLSGEDMRRHMYLVTDAAGRDLCLRPDLTIPVARHYLDAGSSGTAREFLLSRSGVSRPRGRGRRVHAGRYRVFRQS